MKEPPSGKKLSVRERKVVKAKVKGKTNEAALLEAGYAATTARHKGSQKIKELQPAITALMDKMGLTDKYLLSTLKEELEAEETKFFQHEGKVTDERNAVCHDARLNALDKAFKLKGSYATEKLEGKLDVTFSLITDDKDGGLEIE